KKVVTEGHFCINGYSVLYSDGTAKASETKYCEEDNQGGNGSGSNSGNGNGGSIPNSSTVLTYNPETDFFGAVNPNTGEWKDLVYAGFNKNDILYSAFSNSMYTRLNSNKASFSITDSEVSLVENGSLAAGSTSTVIFTTPIYINDNTKITLKSQLWKNGPNENGYAQIFISPHKSFPNGVPRTPNVWINSPDILVLRNNYNDASNQWVEYNLDGVNLKNMLSGKFSDFTIPYYVGIDVSNNYANSRGGIKITKLYTD
ncbi:MAG: hypothetical protein IJ715_03555, partial [Bacilli bacterium]|nr:hypothetical protein [Bacilli bacterium]